MSFISGLLSGLGIFCIIMAALELFAAFHHNDE